MPLRTSKLSVSFDDMMKDTSPLSMLHYFRQYLDTLNALHLIQFWFAVESFKASVAGAVKDRPRPAERRGMKSLTRAGSFGGGSSGYSPGVGVGDSKVCKVNARMTAPMITSKVTGQDEASHEFDCGGGGGGGVGGGGGGSGSSKDGGDGGGKRGGEDSSDGGDVSSGGGGMRILQRRDTENYMYCNCKFHAWPTAPLTPEGEGVSSRDRSPKANGKPSLMQESPGLTVICEHGSGLRSRRSSEPTATCSQAVSDSSHSSRPS